MQTVICYNAFSLFNPYCSSAFLCFFFFFVSFVFAFLSFPLFLLNIYYLSVSFDIAKNENNKKIISSYCLLLSLA